MKLARHCALPLAFALAVHGAADAGVLNDHRGRWMGELKLPDGRILKSGVDIFERADGKLWASFSSPDQDAFDVPVISIKEDGNTAEVAVPFGVAQMTWQDDHFKAVWKQGGQAFPYDMRKVDAFPMRARPQTPQAPFPYQQQELAIAGADGVMLGATLTLPKGKTRPALAILVHGSGPNTRDEVMAGHRIFAVIADHLTRQGIAVLRYDKRGIAYSTGDYINHTQAHLVNDLAAVVQAMRARHQFGRIGVIGHSEGPMLGAAVAARAPKSLDFLVSLAGVGLSGTEMMLLQDRLAATDRGASDAEAQRVVDYARRFYNTVLANEQSEARMAALKMLHSEATPEDQALLKKLKMNQGSLSMGMAAQPALRVMLAVDPQADWRRVNCPVLALNGALDHQVPAESMSGIVAALQAGGNRKVESVVLPKVNHMFQTAKTGSEDEYEQIDETITPVALDRMAQFIRRQR